MKFTRKKWSVLCFVYLCHFILYSVAINLTSRKQSSASGVKTDRVGGCIDPGDVEYGVRSPASSVKLFRNVTSVIQFKCRNGYFLLGKPKMFCSKNGKWKPSKKPKCRLRTCPLPLVANGQASVIDVEYYPASQVTVVCNNGFELKNKENSLIECTSNGTWASASRVHPMKLPQCTEKLCNLPGEPKNGTLNVHGRRNIDSKYFSNSYVTYQCFPGFKLSNYEFSHRICRDGRWTGRSPICEIISCYNPQKILNGGYVSIKTPPVSSDALYIPPYPVGTVVLYQCDPRYTLIGMDRIHCTITGTWSPAIPPVCKHSIISAEPLCDLPMPIEHGDYTVFGRSERTGVMTGTVLQYSCDVGYKLRGCVQSRRVCKNGRWAGPVPQCVPYVGCDKPPVISYGGLVGWDKNTPEVYPIGSRVYYMCYNGYQLSGEPQLLCRSNGCWSSRIAPVCQASYHDSRSLSRPSTVDDEDLYDVKTISLATAGSVIGILVIILVLFTLRRKLTPLGSRRIVLSSPLQSASGQNDRHQATNSHQIQDPDRLALIAFADNVQVVLPTYEEAIRDHPPSIPNLGSANCLPNRVGSDRSMRFSRSRLPGMPPAPPYRGVRVVPPSVGDYQNLPSVRHQQNIRGSAVRSSSVSASTGDSMGSTDTMTPSEISTTVTVETLSSNASTGGSSQATTASCRALCGSLTSFDTASTANTEGAPLLEENEESDQFETASVDDKKYMED